MITIYNRNSDTDTPEWIAVFSNNGSYYERYRRATMVNVVVAQILFQDFIDAAFETLYAATPEGTSFEMVEFTCNPIFEIRFRIDATLAKDLEDSGKYLLATELFDSCLDLALEAADKRLKARSR
ncbi:hypothetical protein A8A54_21245 [Brucella pseudogrignonensis]|uniref:hypothetical protein n=1 Tax=Brucella pseudogrignonensis TaxID=419475 RepID=UPI0002B9127B|nr:hypothetical protein [Brucella pseudogrignonensis]ANG99094.1 hypothetical protein A8A54_21245 [Brucella pseudogrignonensis]EMG51259.1 hypothetical protein WYI_23410 [Ochrobactrum sp. CDB2]